MEVFKAPHVSLRKVPELIPLFVSFVISAGRPCTFCTLNVRVEYGVLRTCTCLPSTVFHAHLHLVESSKVNYMYTYLKVAKDESQWQVSLSFSAADYNAAVRERSRHLDKRSKNYRKGTQPPRSIRLSWDQEVLATLHFKS